MSQNFLFHFRTLKLVKSPLPSAESCPVASDSPLLLLSMVIEQTHLMSSQCQALDQMLK